MSPKENLAKKDNISAAINCNEVYAGIYEKKAHVRRVAQTPRAKEEIIGASPKKLTF